MAQTHEVKRRVPHAPSDVFDLVADVRDYPSFINFIRTMTVLQDDSSRGVGQMTARAVIGYKFVKETFTTTVHLDKPNLAIDVNFVDGPLSVLENRWRFAEEPDGSTMVDFWIRYEFKIPILQSLLKANLGKAATMMIDAFERKAAVRFPMVGQPNATQVG